MNLLIQKKPISSGWMKLDMLMALFIILLTPDARAQKRMVLDENNMIYTVAEKSAEFPGGSNAFYAYLAKNIKYPEQAKAKKVQGKVFLTFIIEKNGTLSNVKVIRGIGAGCDGEAIRVIKASLKWQPGAQNFKPIRQQCTVPIAFSLAK